MSIYRDVVKLFVPHFSHYLKGGAGYRSGRKFSWSRPKTHKTTPGGSRQEDRQRKYKNRPNLNCK